MFVKIVQDAQRIVKVIKIIVTHLMIKKTMTITSLAILVAAISVVTTMTIVQADTTGDTVNIDIPQATIPNTDVVVNGAPEYSSTMPVTNALLTFTDTGDTLVQIGELAITNPGTGVHSGIFNFPDVATGAIVTFTDTGNESVEIGELVVTFAGAAPVANAAIALAATVHPIEVDITGGAGIQTVEIDLTAGSPVLGNIVVTIDGVEWLGETGVIGSFACSSSVGATSTPLFDKDTLEVTISSVVIGDTIDIICEFEGFHGEIDKVLLETCLSTDLEVKRSMAQTCTFNITYDGVPATIVDTISAGWEEDPVFTGDNDECSVDAPKGKNKKNNDKSATGFTCQDVTTPADFDVTVTTRESPGKGHEKKSEIVFKPTSCSEPFGEPFDINSGAKAILLDSNGNVVLGTLDGLPIVLDSTDPLSVDVGENTSDGITCAEA